MEKIILRNLKILAFFVAIFGFVVLLLWRGVHVAENYTRDEHLLLSKYYSLRYKNPQAAKAALDIALRQDPDSLRAKEALADWESRNLKTPAQKSSFENNLAENADIEISADQKEAETTNQSTASISPLPKSSPFPLTQSSIASANTLTKPATIASDQSTALLNQYYELKKTDPNKAYTLIQQIVAQYPDNVMALKEAGYGAIAQNDNRSALIYFLQVYFLTKDPEIAMQIGYLYDGLDQKRKAYHYFQIATSSIDQTLKQKAELAMSNIGSEHMKILPDPWFASIYAAPFYFSRFDLLVYPATARFGITLNKAHHFELYLSYRYTKDNRSGALLGELPQIYEDDVEIYALGTSVQPFTQFPMIAFFEYGRAYDLIYRNRDRWRDDARGGLVLFKDWGARPTYSGNMNFTAKPVGEVYSDLIYFSRYDNNVIGNLRLRQGLRVLEYRAANMDIYMTGHLILDKNHEFFNNIFEWGPGIVLRPSNRYNIALRFEMLQGYYIKVNSPDPNPYPPQYHNNVTQLELFYRF